MGYIEYSQFEEISIKVGEILSVEKIDNARSSTHKVMINLGDEIGVKKSCARLVNYNGVDLVGKQVLCVTNFKPKQIGSNISEVLILGVPSDNGECVLITPDSNVPLGGKVY